jgi:amidase
MSRSLTTLRLYCKAVLSNEMSPWHIDPKCLAIPWRNGVINPPGRKLRFGIISDNDGEISVHPPIVRGLAMTKKALEKAGHEVFEWSAKNHPEMTREMNNSFYTLGGAAIIGLTREHGEPVFESMKSYERAYEQGEHETLGPTKLREMIKRISKRIPGSLECDRCGWKANYGWYHLACFALDCTKTGCYSDRHFLCKLHGSLQPAW